MHENLALEAIVTALESIAESLKVLALPEVERQQRERDARDERDLQELAARENEIERIARKLDEIGCPLDASERSAREALKELADVQASRVIVAQAIERRRRADYDGGLPRVVSS